MTYAGSRKKSLVCNNKDAQFFSLVDYRNNYFTSNDPNKIIEFYNSFENREQLIQWMKERPKGIANIYEVDGEKDIIVVIPTADFHGKYARECRENIFKGLHIIFVESGEIPDPYFNYAHNCNVGIRKAMEYNPKWVVVSNDDMYRLDDVNVLRRELQDIIGLNFPLILANHQKKGLYVSKDMLLVKITGILKLLHKRLHAWLAIPPEMPLYSKNFYYHFTDYRPESSKYKLSKIFFRDQIIPFVNLNAFGIFSGEFLENYKNDVFDETFINGFEDIDLSLRLELEYGIKYVNYNIAGYEGSTIGNSNDPLKFRSRHLRDIANYMYIDSKLLEIFNLRLPLGTNGEKKENR